MLSSALTRLPASFELSVERSQGVSRQLREGKVMDNNRMGLIPTGASDPAYAGLPIPLPVDPSTYYQNRNIEPVPYNAAPRPIRQSEFNSDPSTFDILYVFSPAHWQMLHASRRVPTVNPNASQPGGEENPPNQFLNIRQPAPFGMGDLLQASGREIS